MVKYSALLLVIFVSTVVTLGQTADSIRVKTHLTNIINTSQPRNHQNIAVLNSVAEYIHTHFNQFADSTGYQEFQVSQYTYKNVIGSFGTENDTRIIIGAHYDVCGDQDGADDNASGIVGLLELARMLKGKKLNTRIDLVAYSLEEPPYFRTKSMGSYVHAEWLYENEIDVEGMICLEMIGYFNDEKGSQDYPLGFLKLFYGNNGDYITVVRKLNGGKFARKFKRSMKKTDEVETKSFQAPGRLTGIDFSDHLSYWHFGYSALMITNTGFYRNKNYHQITDKIETLDVNRMTGVIQAVYDSVIKLAEKKK